MSTTCGCQCTATHSAWCCVGFARFSGLNETEAHCSCPLLLKDMKSTCAHPPTCDIFIVPNEALGQCFRLCS